jgi:hypothetical protein
VIFNIWSYLPTLGGILAKRVRHLRCHFKAYNLMIVQFLSLDCVAANFMMNLCFCLFPTCHTAHYGAIPAYAIGILPLTTQRSYNMVHSMFDK